MMIKKVAVALLIVMLLLIGVALISPEGEGEEKKDNIEKMVEFALEDAKEKFPNASVELVAVLPLEEKGERVETNLTLVIVKAVYWKTPICPIRYHVRYIFPLRGFSNMPPELIVGDCGLCKEGRCKVKLKEEAVIASLNVKGTEWLREAVLNEGGKPKVLEDDGAKIWHVVWEVGGKKYMVVLDENGQLIEVEGR